MMRTLLLLAVLFAAGPCSDTKPAAQEGTATMPPAPPPSPAPVQLGTTPVAVPVDLPSSAARAVGAEEEMIFLHLDGVETPRHPGGYYEIHLQLPDGARELAATLSFYGAPQRGGREDRVFPVEEAVAKLLLRSPTLSRIEVVFVPQGEMRYPPRIGAVRLTVERPR